MVFWTLLHVRGLAKKVGGGGGGTGKTEEDMTGSSEYVGQEASRHGIDKTGKDHWAGKDIRWGEALLMYAHQHRKLTDTWQTMLANFRPFLPQFPSIVSLMSWAPLDHDFDYALTNSANFTPLQPIHPTKVGINTSSSSAGLRLG